MPFLHVVDKNPLIVAWSLFLPLMYYLLNIWETVERLDKSIFMKLNGDWTNPFFDAVLPYFRYSNTWMPLYLFLFVFAVINFKGRGFWWFVFFVCTIALSDMTGTYVFKHNIQRLRPCSDPEFSMNVRLLLKQCAGGYGFISNHSANHFGMATFFFLTFRNVIPKWAWIGFLWAAIIVYSQIYVGVHYPLDVIAGGIVGILIGCLTAFIFNKSFGFANFDKEPIVTS